MYKFVRHFKFKILSIFWIVIFIIQIQNQASCEGTKQLESIAFPDHSFCRLALTQDTSAYRIPFALTNCSEEYRLNIFIGDFTSEKIYLGFGLITDYSNDSVYFRDVKFQLRDPLGNIVPGFSLATVPSDPSEPGFITSRSEALQGPDINHSNPQGYSPLVVTPSLNGNYYIEFDIPIMEPNKARVFKLFDITVAKDNVPIEGRLWSKAWQLTSSTVTASDNGSFSKFYIYSNDSIVARFDCNGLAGGIWSIYSNQWGCSTVGNWSERRQSIKGNTSVKPEYKIFINDPDQINFPTGRIGQLSSFMVLPVDCDTAVTFISNVNKAGNLEVRLDLPPFSPDSPGPEDVQLGYPVTAGENILYPPWNGKNALGMIVPNGTQVIARVTFLNGLSNIPLFDVEDNPHGFKVDIQRPLPITGSSKLKLYWDDTRLPQKNFPTSNTVDGCIYSGTDSVSGCHNWLKDNDLGNNNTINSWWYYTTGNSMVVPIVLRLKPASGSINGANHLCEGQSFTFRTKNIPYADKYQWQITGPSFNYETEISAPDTILTYQFVQGMKEGIYIISVLGKNSECGDGISASFSTYLHSNIPPIIKGNINACNYTTESYQIDGPISSVNWSLIKGEIVGTPSGNKVTIRWLQPGVDTINADFLNDYCGNQHSQIPVLVEPSIRADFEASKDFVSCPGVPITFSDASIPDEGKAEHRYWDWGDGSQIVIDDSITTHTYSNTGLVNITFKVANSLNCINVKEKQFNIIPNPVAGFVANRNCLNERVELKDRSTGDYISSWKWDFGQGTAIQNSINSKNAEAVFKNLGIFPIQLKVENLFGCADSISRSIIIHKLPTALFDNSIPCREAKIILTDRSTAADTTLALYNWWTEGDTPGLLAESGNSVILKVEDTGPHLVYHEVIDNFGCSDTISKEIIVNDHPDSKFTIQKDIGNIPGLIKFNNESIGAVSYYWDFGDGRSSTDEEPQIKYNIQGAYTIRLVGVNLDMCTDTAMMNYYYIPGFWIPNAFTPDFDGLNDVFRPVTDRVVFSSYTMRIFNKWGGLVFESEDPKTGWDGTFKGEPCPLGEYWYIIEFNGSEAEGSDNFKLKGFINLIR
ncbi:MAG: gliding motility-associated C-terminal domain-containing protein [Bacteroidetes bacterium]|nr:gliding motility-associated C-terminal domain-containing protein [Bacteroidota bacterium]